MMINCEDTPQAIMAALKKLEDLARKLALKLGLNPDLLAKILIAMLKALVELYGARNAMRLYDSYIDAAVREAQRITDQQSQQGNVPGAGANGSGSWTDGVGSRPAGGGINGGIVPPGWLPPGWYQPGWETADTPYYDFFDPRQPGPGGTASGPGGSANLPGLPWGSVPGPDGLPVDSYTPLNPLDPFDPNYGLPSPVLPGIPITKEEWADYYAGRRGCDDYKFWILSWLHPEDNPALLLDALPWAKRMHRSIIMPIARRYHIENFGGIEAGGCLTMIRYGLLSASMTRTRLGAGPPSLKFINQTVNFSVIGVPDEVVVDDIANGRIEGIRVGTFGVSSGVHASLPFYIGGETVERLHLFKMPGVPGHIGYDWK